MREQELLNKEPRRSVDALIGIYERKITKFDTVGATLVGQPSISYTSGNKERLKIY